MARKSTIKKIDILVDEALKTPQGREIISDHLRKTLNKSKRGIA